MSASPAPQLEALLANLPARAGKKPLAFVLSGHNGSGKSTLWKERLAPVLKRPLINADRLISSILPEAGPSGHLVSWAAALRDNDARWQRLAQDGVQTFLGLIVDQKMSFGFETVFSHWVENPDGTVESKVDVIKNLQQAGYYVVLIFVGLHNVALSIARVSTRKAQGGHTVDEKKLRERFPRTQKAVGHALAVADMSILFDNSFGPERAFSLVRVQNGNKVRFDCRDPLIKGPSKLDVVANHWLMNVCGPFV
jgi:predicted ABC-type ATPase